MRIVGSARILAALVLPCLVGSPAAAQVFGTFTWQMQPYCNRVTLTLTSVVPGFTLDGSDDQCGAATKGSVTGIGVFNPNGTVGLNFTIVTSPAGQGVHVSAIVSPANGQGTWSDNAGNSGTFAFFAAVPGLTTRPAATDPVDVAANPNQVSDPCSGPLPQTLQLCGTSAARWVNGGLGMPGVQVWRDALGQMHMRGSATRTAGQIGGFVMVLPAALRPARLLSFQVATTLTAGSLQTGSAFLLVLPRDHPDGPGVVLVSHPSDASHNVMHLGEIVFRVDR
jgi:hypothetical protein